MLPLEVRRRASAAGSQIIDYLSLVGDTVDNVPGVLQQGRPDEDGNVKWLLEHGSLDGVIAAAPTMKGAVGENLRQALDWLPQGAQGSSPSSPTTTWPPHVEGWPVLDDELAPSARSDHDAACSTSTSATASAAWHQELAGKALVRC